MSEKKRNENIELAVANCLLTKRTYGINATKIVNGLMFSTLAACELNTLLWSVNTIDHTNKTGRLDKQVS